MCAPLRIADLLPEAIARSANATDAGRLSSLTLPSGVIGYGYKAGSGQLANITAPGGIGIAYAYDGALLKNTTFTGPVAGSVNAAYDNFFRVSSVGVNGSNVAYAYDADGLLTGAGGLTLSRDSGNGLVTGSTLGQIVTSQSYDDFGQLASFTARQGATVLYNEQITQRDNLGRVSQKTLTLNGQTSVYGYLYDPAGRLTDVTKDGAAAGHFEYDANGNRTLAYGIAASYDDQDRLTTFGGAQYSYTANGELEQVVSGTGTTGYSYDVFGNLTHVDLANGGKLDYLVDGRNRRIGKKVNGALAQGFLYQDQLKPAAELDGQGNVVSRFVYAGRANVPEYMVKGGVTYRIIGDQLGSVRLVVNSATGQIAQRIDYDEWGNVQGDSNPGFQPFGYAGGLYDRVTGLVRFGARDYDARIGRWTAKDPIGFGGGDTSLFNYVGGDPLNYIDPLGLEKIILLPSGDINYPAANAAPDVSGQLTIYSHGNPNRVNGMNASQLADFIRNSRKWNQNVPIKLDACRTAEGDSNIAKDVSSILGTVVTAPNARTLTSGESDLGVWHSVNIPGTDRTIPYWPGQWITYSSGNKK